MSRFLDLLFPPLCIGCSTPIKSNRSDPLSWLCLPCRSAWLCAPQISLISGVPYCHAVEYQPSVRQIVLRAKEENDRMAQQILSDVISTCIAHLDLEAPFALMAMPSSAKANRARGYQHAEILAKQVGQSLGLPRMENGLTHRRRVSDQSGLSALDRAANVVDSFLVSARARNNPVSVVVIDDVVTTGSSMREAVRALRAADIPVLALISAVATGRQRGADTLDFAIR
jgi:ComF family protein